MEASSSTDIGAVRPPSQPPAAQVAFMPAKAIELGSPGALIPSPGDSCLIPEMGGEMLSRLQVEAVVPERATGRQQLVKDALYEATGPVVHVPVERVHAPDGVSVANVNLGIQPQKAARGKFHVNGTLAAAGGEGGGRQHATASFMEAGAADEYDLTLGAPPPPPTP